MSDLVRLKVEGGIATILLNRPPMNALNAEIQTALGEAAAEVTSRRDVSAVILYGGEKVFAAGADIKEMEKMSYTDMADHAGTLQDFTRAIARIPKPTVAAKKKAAKARRAAQARRAARARQAKRVARAHDAKRAKRPRLQRSARRP